MGKRSGFERSERDFYRTPPAAVPPLIPHLRGVHSFAEPCCGDGALVRHLEAHGLRWGDIVPAIVAGYEVHTRLLLAVQPSHWYKGFQGTGTFGTCGAAARLPADLRGTRPAPCRPTKGRTSRPGRRAPASRYSL